MMYNEFNNPYFTPKENLQIAIGGVMFRDDVIKNLRQQIRVLRELGLQFYTESNLDELQYKHIRSTKESK